MRIAILAMAAALLSLLAYLDRSFADSGMWVMRVETSKITDTENVFLSLDSINLIPRDYRDSAPARLFIRCLDNETDVLFTMNENWFRDDQLVVTRVDKSKPHKEWWGDSSDHIAAFSPKPIAFIRRLLAGKYLVIQTTPINAPIYEAEFDLTGLDAVIGRVQKACQWK